MGFKVQAYNTNTITIAYLYCLHINYKNEKLQCSLQYYVFGL